MEKIITINDWCDCPRIGLAYYNGVVCIYERNFDYPEIEDPVKYDDFDFDKDFIIEYYLTPVTDSEKDEIMADWQEWCTACSNNDIESFYKNHRQKPIIIEEILNNSTPRRKYRKKAKFKGQREFGHISVDYFVEWYD